MILALYAFITVTFPFAHTDYVPLESRLVLSPAGSSSHALDSGAEEITCPAHQFAQSTSGTPISNQSFTSQLTVFSLRIDETVDHFIEPTNSYSTRAPPLA